MKFKNDLIRNVDPIPAESFMESPSERRYRRLSLIIVNLIGFQLSLGFSIALTGIYPYLIQLDPSADKSFLGWVVAANPIGQFIACPTIGWLGNRTKSIRLLTIASVLLYCIGFILYSSLGALPQPRKYYMILARFLIGIASGAVTLFLTYVTRATTLEERTTFVSINALAQSAGFIIGPILQSALISLGEEGPIIGPRDMQFNMFTAAGWISVILAFATLFLLIPCIFREYNVADKEAKIMEQQKLYQISEQPGKVSTEPGNVKDVFGAILCIVTYSIVGFDFVIVETLGTPLAIDQLGYSDEEAVEKVGILLTVGGICIPICFGLAGLLAKRFTERKVLLFLGLLPLVISNALFLPFGGPPLLTRNTTRLEEAINMTATSEIHPNQTFEVLPSPMELVLTANSTSQRGCPPTQEWCFHTPALHAEQMIIGFVLMAIGYSFATSMSTSILSQVLGSSQGTWMGVYHAGGSLSRILGPIYVGFIYTVYGTLPTFASITSMLAVVLVADIFFCKHFIPLIKR